MNFKYKFLIIFSATSLLFITCFILLNSIQTGLEINLILLLVIIITFNLLIHNFNFKKTDIFEPLYLFSFLYVVLFVLRPLYIFIENDYKFLSLLRASDSYFKPVLISINIGYICFAAGYRIKSEKMIKLFNVFIPRINENDISMKKLSLFSCIISVFAFLTYAYFYVYKMTLFSSVDIFTENTAYIYYGLDLLIPATIILFLIKIKNKKYAWTLIYLLSLLATIFIYSGLHARYRWVALILILTIFFYLQKDKRPSITFILISLSLLMLGFGLTGILRGITLENISFGELIDTLDFKSIALRFISSDGDTAMFDMLVLYFQEIPANLDYLYGLGFFQAFIHPVPRLIWASKPILPSVFFMQQVLPDYYYYGIGFASSIFGDLYWNFGYLGIPLGMFLIGIFLKTLYVWLLRNKNLLSAKLTYAYILAYLPMYLRGEFIGTSVWFLFTYIPLFLSLKYSGSFKKKEIAN